MPTKNPKAWSAGPVVLFVLEITSTVRLFAHPLSIFPSLLYWEIRESNPKASTSLLSINFALLANLYVPVANSHSFTDSVSLGLVSVQRPQVGLICSLRGFAAARFPGFVGTGRLSFKITPSRLFFCLWLLRKRNCHSLFDPHHATTGSKISKHIPDHKTYDFFLAQKGH